MPTVESVLREKTHKGDVDTIRERVFYTLTDHKGTEATQTARLLSLMIERLHEKSNLNDQDIDNMLLEIVG